MIREIIKRGSEVYVRNNFKHKEIASKSLDRGFSDGLEEINISSAVLDCLQIIRDYYGVPMEINSSGRSKLHNAYAGGATNSQHLYKNLTALDFKFQGMMVNGSKGYKASVNFQNDMVNKGQLYEILKQNGLRGIGYYNTFFHIDTRAQNHLSEWDNSNGSRLGKNIIVGELSNIFTMSEDGIIDKKDSVLVRSLIGLGVFFLIRQIVKK